MWREEGFRGFMRGNGINCIRIVPYRYVNGLHASGLFFTMLGLNSIQEADHSSLSLVVSLSAVQFTTYEQLKKVWIFALSRQY